MKALVLDGEEVKVTHEWADLEHAYAKKIPFWVELDEETPEADAFLKDTLHIHALAVEDLWHDVGLPKIEDFGEYIQVIVHGVREADKNLKRMPLALAELDIIIGKTFLVSHANDEKTCAVTPTQEEVRRNPKLLKKGPRTSRTRCSTTSSTSTCRSSIASTRRSSTSRARSSPRTKIRPARATK